ncbi:calmodulin-binding-domain-containing protein [Cladochytrium replicatum]|nr:calmodulin-binding-domain-containing protein [Cladochytrium replicatum]
MGSASHYQQQLPPGTVIRTQPVPPDPFEESVYKLIPEHIPPPEKQKMYRSKFAKQARDEFFSGMKTAASMGPAKVKLGGPEEFVRRGDRERNAAPVTKFDPDRTIRKDPVPKTPGKSLGATGKDFINLNALEMINSAATRKIDNRPQYRFKKDYGKTPTYIQQRNADSERSRELHAAELEEMQQHSLGKGKEGYVRLPEEERFRILGGLKANWEKLNSDYQKLSLTVDTVPKIARKVNMEQQLKQLESHIQKFSHPEIHVNIQ